MISHVVVDVVDALIVDGSVSIKSNLILVEIVVDVVVVVVGRAKTDDFVVVAVVVELVDNIVGALVDGTEHALLSSMFFTVFRML